jgi:xanthine dehydrogenase accessory factor
MRDVLTDLESWWRSGEAVGLATVVGTWRSAPRQPGAAMLVGSDGTAVGSVSGGCVEGAVYELAEQTRDGGRPVLQRYGVSDDDAFSVGLTCGGIIDIFVERVDRTSFPELGAIAADIRDGRPVAVATLISGVDADRLGRRLVIRPDEVSGSLGSARLDDAVGDDAQGLLRQGSTGILRYGPDGERRGDDIGVFVASYAPKPRMIVFGAIDFAAAVARIGAFLGYRVTVCDARPTFATKRRFPDADEVVVAWPHRYLAKTDVDERTVVCVLTHDPKFDVPLLEIALRLPLAYIGAMGSRRTNEDRAARLRELGITDEQLARLHAPIGLDVGGRTPEETAVSVAAEIIGAQWGGSGAQLRLTDGPIHRAAGGTAIDDAGGTAVGDAVRSAS